MTSNPRSDPDVWSHSCHATKTQSPPPADPPPPLGAPAPPTAASTPTSDVGFWGPHSCVSLGPRRAHSISSGPKLLLPKPKSHTRFNLLFLPLPLLVMPPVSLSWTPISYSSSQSRGTCPPPTILFWDLCPLFWALVPPPSLSHPITPHPIPSSYPKTRPTSLCCPGPSLA